MLLPNVMGMRSAVTMEFSNRKYVPRLKTLAGVDEMVEALGRLSAMPLELWVPEGVDPLLQICQI